MYSRLYTSVLNQHHSVDYCASFHHCYLDSGLFGLNISVHPSFVSQTPHLVAGQLDAITRPVRNGMDEQDLRRARNQLKSGLMMALESRMVQVEDLGVSSRAAFLALVELTFLFLHSAKFKCTTAKFPWRKWSGSSMPSR